MPEATSGVLIGAPGGLHNPIERHARECNHFAHCSSLAAMPAACRSRLLHERPWTGSTPSRPEASTPAGSEVATRADRATRDPDCGHRDRKSTRLNSSHTVISYAV